MRALVFVIFFICFCKEIHGQRLVPIFKSKEDSLALAALDAKINEINKRGSDTGEYDDIDSLYQLRREFLDKHPFTLRAIYSQNRNFTPYQKLYLIKNRDSITRISILGEGSKKLPDSLYLYKNLKELELINFRLSKLPKKLMDLPSLTKLTISNNFPSRRLKLSKNNMIDSLIMHGDENRKLPKSFRHFKNLQFLQLTHNNLKKIPNVAGCHNLVRFDLNFNEITVIPRSVRRYRSLRSLNLNNNLVYKIKPGINKLGRLEELDLYKCKLKAIPPELYTMTQLKVIDLFSNELKTVSPKISNWKNLEILYIAGNELTSLSEEIGQLTSLRELYIHHNYLNQLPSSIGNLTSLYTLRMNNNYMTEWPTALTNLKTLRNFDCSENPWSPEAKKEISSWAKFLRDYNNTFVVE